MLFDERSEEKSKIEAQKKGAKKCQESRAAKRRDQTDTGARRQNTSMSN
jgi:hypothetical protein